MRLLFVVTALLQQPVPPTAVAIPRLDAVVTIDGKLDENAWASAARLSGFRQYEPVDGRPAEEQTEVLVWYAPDAIHFGIIAKDREPSTIRASRADRDNIAGEDHVVIFLDTFNDRRRAFFFGVNALGVQTDGVRTEGAGSAGRMFGNNTDYSPDYIFESKGARTPEGYIVEVRIPFKTLRYPGGREQNWGLQIERKTQRTGYVDTWTDVRRASASYLVQAGSITGLHDLERGVVIEAQPFVTAASNGQMQDGRFQRNDQTADAGANLKVSFTNLAVDATINPDFSQIESDAGQVTINERFALFFPEKRPFFLEGIELFNVPSQLVYTRQVVAPLGGAKLTGKVGPFGIAHLTAIDEDVATSCIENCAGVSLSRAKALFNITRLRTDFSRNSLAGILFSDRSLTEHGEYNRVIAADTRVVFARLYYVEGQLGHSWTRDAFGNTQSAPLWKFDADRTGRRWGFHYSLSGIPDEFDTRVGFVPRRNIVRASALNRISFYGRPGANLEQITVFAGPTYIWHYDDFGRDGAIERTESANTTFRFRGGWSSTVTTARNYYEIDQARYLSYQSGGSTYQALEEVAGPNLQLSVNSPVFRRFDANVTIGRAVAPIFAEGSEGATWTTTGSLSLRPTTAIRIGWTGGRQLLQRTSTDTEFARTLLSRVKLEYQPTRALSFRGIADYRVERQSALSDARTGAPLMLNGQVAPGFDRRSLRADLLMSYEPRPGTVAFFGYGSSLDEVPFTQRLDRTSDGFFLKLAYQFRR